MFSESNESELAKLLNHVDTVAIPPEVPEPRGFGKVIKTAKELFVAKPQDFCGNAYSTAPLRQASKDAANATINPVGVQTC